MIVFDMEWNSGLYERTELDEILQIGAVKLERLGGPVLDTFNAYIKPCVHKRRAPPVQELPELEQCETSQLDFPTAAAEFFRWCGEGERFGTWGTSDFAALLQNLRYWEVNAPLPDQFYDLQAAFAAAAGASKQPALHHAVEYCGIPDVFDYHNAQNDALYTALVGAFVGEAELAASLRTPHEPRRRAKTDLPPDPALGAPRWTSQRYGPFADEERMLNNRGCRLAVCPVCGHKLRVSDWHRTGDGPYFSKFSCREHGTFFLRLAWERDPQALLWAASQVLDPTQGVRLAFRAAKRGQAFQCSLTAAAKRRRRRVRRKTSRIDAIS